MAEFLKNKSKGWFVYGASALFALISLIIYIARGGDIFTKVLPVAVVLSILGILLSIGMMVKDIKPLEIVPFILYFISLLIFFGSEIEFIGNVAYGTDGQAISAAFVCIAVFGLLAVICGMTGSIMKIEKEE